MHEVLNPQTALVYYGGNVTASKELFADYPVNTDDKPVIEYMAPRRYRNQGTDKMPWFVGPYILKFIKDLQKACPPDQDPLLVNRTPANRRFHWPAARIKRQSYGRDSATMPSASGIGGNSSRSGLTSRIML